MRAFVGDVGPKRFYSFDSDVIRCLISFALNQDQGRTRPVRIGRPDADINAPVLCSRTELDFKALLIEEFRRETLEVSPVHSGKILSVVHEIVDITLVEVELWISEITPGRAGGFIL